MFSKLFGKRKKRKQSSPSRAMQSSTSSVHNSIHDVSTLNTIHLSSVDDSCSRYNSDSYSSSSSCSYDNSSSSDSGSSSSYD